MSAIGVGVGTAFQGRPRGGAVPIDPLTFDETKLVWDARDNTYIWNAPSTPVVDFDPIQQWHDLANSPGAILSSSSSSYYPKWRANGKVYYENDRQQVLANWPGNISSTPMTVLALATLVPDPVSAQTLFDGDSPYAMAVRFAASGSGIFTMGAGGTTWNTTHAVPVETRAICFFEFNAANSGMWVSPDSFGVDPWTETGICGTDADIANVHVGADSTGSNRLRNGSGFWYLAYIAKVLTDLEKDGVGLWLEANMYGNPEWKFSLS